MRPLATAMAMCSMLVAACAARTDIARSDDEVEAWVEAQRARDRTPGSQLGDARTEHRVSGPDERPRLPERAPPPGWRPAPVAGAGGHRPTLPGTRPTAAPTEGHRTVLGSCFAVDGEGAVVTAHHVIDGSANIYVSFGAEALQPARVVRSSASTDVALLAIDRRTSDFLPVASPHSAKVGMPVFTVGFPLLQLLGSEPRFTDGSVSALSGIGGEGAFMQISVPLQPGNSGGPLISDRGEVLGVTVSGASAAAVFRQTGQLPQNINFASKGVNIHALSSRALASAEPAVDREAAIARALRAVCRVVASR